MSAVKGELVRCTRCDNALFLKFIERTQMDGGYSHYDQYQDLPKNWILDHRFGYLCPKCSSEFCRTIGGFFGGSISPNPWGYEEDHSCEVYSVKLHMIKEAEE